ncbi:transporter substrate-binding domain-containing protein [Paracoccus laeviglucosivorans]|uniref:Amino acid ABC transporter substrate-binding protein, PAAT family n=1 Tax=Paracoccus laeviglucosivorans TaxID=1197861 RepID=A0A521FJS4_9RHOB|nr:transporter substrate-binding domain-containing protein [Paracoccus laeviglucosivorans]SMO96349.1 amino acid ABC transporter substrate-binding protein, PAAT family [Paracoccus laeviglucosivorans]
MCITTGFKKIVAGALMATTFMASAALAITPDELREKGKAVIGVQMDQFPWGFIDEAGKNEGFDIDVAKLIAADLGVEPEFFRITGQNRIPSLTTGQVDFLVPSMTVTAERAQVIQFVLPYSSNNITVWARTDAEITKNEDLGGYVIGVNRGSAFEPILSDAAPQGTEIRGYEDDATTVQALLSGQVDAIVGSKTYGIVIQNTGRGDGYEAKYKVADNIQAMAVRKGDQEMLDYLNDFVTRHDAELDELYLKWIGQDRADLPTELPGVDFTGKAGN